MIKLIKESYGDLSDYLERHLDSWYGRLNELQDAVEDLGLNVDEINNEYVIVHAAEPDGEDVYCKIWLGGTPRTISLETFEMLESVRRSKKAISEFYRYSYDNQRISDILDKIEQTNDQRKIDKAYDFINHACDNIDDCTETGFYDLSNASWAYGTDYIIEELTDILNESIKRKNGKSIKENLYRVWYNPYLLEPDEEDYIEVTAETADDARQHARSKGYVTSVEEIDHLTDPYDECLDEANVVGMGGGYPNVYLPKAAKEYLKRRGFQEVDTEIGPCFYMRFTGNQVWEIYIDEQYGGIYVVEEGYDIKPTDDIATIDDYDYKDDIDAVINLGNCLSNGEDFDTCLRAFFK